MGTIEELFKCLSMSLLNHDYNNCHRVIKHINCIYRKKAIGLDYETKVDLFCDITFGGLHCLSLCLNDGSNNKFSVKLAKCLRYQIVHFPEYFIKYADRILTICSMLIKSTKSNVNYIGAEILNYLILSKKFPNLETSSIIRSLLDRIHDVDGIVKNTYYELLGTLCENVSSVSSSHIDEIENILLKESEQFDKTVNPKICHGFFTAISGFCDVKTNIPYEQIYYILRSIVQSDRTTKLSYCAAIHLLNKHMPHFIRFMTDDFEIWHNTFNTHITEFNGILKENNCLKEISRAFYLAASRECQQTNTSQFQRFYEDIDKLFANDAKLPLHNVQCLKYFIINNTNYLIKKDKLFYILASEFTSACNDDNVERKAYIGTYLECLTSLVFNKKSVDIVNAYHEATILKCLIFIFGNYTNLYLSCDIIVSLYNAMGCIYSVQPDLVKKLVYQTLKSQTCLDINVDKITTPQYPVLDVQISLWKGLIAAEQASPGHSVVYDCLIEQTIVLFEELNLDNSKISCYGGNCSSNTSPSCCKDVKVLENLIYLIEKILKDSNSLFFIKWTKLFICKMLNLSEKIPNFHGIYEIITTVFELSLLGDKLKEQPPEEIEGNFLEMSKLLLVMLNSTNMSKTVKMASLKLLSILPKKILVIFLDETIQTFINIFKFEASDIDMVIIAVHCVENWIQTIDRLKMKKFLEDVSPHMKYLAHKETYFINVPFGCEDELNSKNTKWLVIQQKIIEILTANGVPTEQNIVRPAHCSLAIAFPDQIFKINLSCAITHIIQVCVNAVVGDSVRITACETLYVVATGIIGQCATLCFEEQKEYIPIFQIILSTVLRLGCDSNPVINALFRALSLQLARAVSSAYLHESFSAPFINFLLDDKNWVNDAMRDLAAACIYEFLNCYLKKGSENGTVVEPFINVIIHDLSCDVKKRLVATKLLNLLLPQLLEDITFFDKYILYIIYSLISSLNLSLLENHYVHETFDIVCNAIKKFGAVICKDNICRIKPESLERVNVLVLLSWLLEQCYTGNAQCRAFSMRVYALLRNVCIKENLKVVQFNTLENFEISTVKKLNLLKIKFIPFMDNGSKVMDVLNWMKELHALLECHTWLVNAIRIESSFVENDKNFILGLCLYIDIICSKDKSNNPIIQTLSTRLSNHNLETLKMSIEIRKVTALLTMKILEFFSLIHVKMFIITDNFATLLLLCMTQPSSLGILSNEENDKVILHLTQIIKLLKEDYEHLWCKLHEQILSTLIQQYLDLANKLPQILKGAKSYTDLDLNLMRGIKYLMAADGDSNRNQEIIIHLEQLPVLIKSSLKDDYGIWLHNNACTRRITTQLIRLQLTAMRHQQLWQDLTECNCQSDEKKDSCVCQIYFNLFMDALGQHILVGCEQIQLGCLRSFLKLNIINKLLTCFKYDLLERFLSRLKLTVIEQSEELIQWADSNTDNLIVFTNLLYNYSSYELQMIHHCRFNDYLLQSHFEKWIFNMIRADSVQIDFIPFVIYFSEDLFKIFLSHINESSTLCAHQIWNNLLLYFDITGNEMILYHLLKYLNNNSLNFITASYKCILNHVDRLSANCQILVLQTAHHISINQTISYKYRVNFLKQFYLVLLKNMDTSIKVQFYQSIFEEMYSYDKAENGVYYKIVMIQLLEIMFGTLDRTTLEEKVLNNCGESIAYSSLVCDLISRCYSARKELRNNIDSELWRIYQCVSFNCLITLLPRNYEDCLSYNFFLFRQKSNECSVWDSLVDTSTSLVFPIYRTSLSEKYYTSFTKAGNMKDLIISEMSSSLTQECTIFDFVGLRTFSKENWKYVGCNLEVDSLNEHECMGAICAAIISLGRTADSTLSKEMPIWMKSLNNCLRNPKLHINTCTFLIKIIFNTRDIFHCYAKHWMGPILYCVNNGACGSNVNHFYCQVVSMLVSWHNIAIPDANNYEGKYASNIVSLITSNIVGKDKKEAKRNFLLLSSCLIKWKDSLECSLETFVPLIKSNDPVELKSSLGVILLYMKNKVMPFKIHEADTFFNLIVNLSNSLLQSIYKIASELIGLYLLSMSENCQSELLVSVETVKKCLNKSYIEDKSAFILRLEGISMHYPKIIDRQFIEFLTYICLIRKLQPIHKIAIDILCKICCNAGTELETTLLNCGIFQLLLSRNDSDQLNILKLLKYLCDNNLLLNIDLNFDKIINLMKSGNLKLLTTTWDLLLLYARKKSVDSNKIDSEVVLCRLIDGIWSRDESTHSTAVRFFLEVYPLSRNVLDVFILLLENLNESIMTDRNCISIILEIILEMSIKSPNCSGNYLTNVFECDHKTFGFENIENPENINLINSYKFGDYPYTEITYKIIAKLLRNLGKVDLTCGVHLLAAIVNGLLQQTKNYEIRKLKLACVISKILNRENMKNNFLRCCLMDIARCNNIATEYDNEKIEVVDEESNEPVQEPPLKWPKYTEQVHF